MKEFWNQLRMQFNRLLHFWQGIPATTRWSLVISFSLGFLFHMGWVQFSNSRNNPVLQSSEGNRILPVASEMVEKRTLKNQFSIHAFLQPKKEVTLRPNSNVKVREVRVEVGQSVKPGDVLVYTDSEAQALRSELDRIDLQLRNIDFGVTVALARKSFLSKREFQQKELEHRASQIRKRLSEIESTGALIAPIAGVVSEINLKPGDYIDNPSNYSVKIADASSFKLQLYLPQSVATKLKKGQKVELTRSGSLSSEKADSATAEVVAVAPVVDPKTGSVLTEVETKQVPPQWISGMYVQAALVTDSAEDALTISSEAVVYENAQAFVFRVKEAQAEESRGPAEATPASRVEKVPVQIGLRDSKFIQVQSGLEEFDRIVVEGQGNLSNGSAVEVIR